MIVEGELTKADASAMIIRMSGDMMVGFCAMCLICTRLRPSERACSSRQTLDSISNKFNFHSLQSNRLVNICSCFALNPQIANQSPLKIFN